MEIRIRDHSPSQAELEDSDHTNLFAIQSSSTMRPLSDFESEITDVDTETHSFLEVKPTSIYSLIGGGWTRKKNDSNVLPKVEDLPQPKNLMSVLTGKQSASKKRNELTKAMKLVQSEDLTGDERSDNLDSSFTEQKGIDYRCDHDIIQLEKKFFPDAKTISSKDIFTRLRQEPKVPETLPEPITIVDEDDPIKEQENKMYGSQAKRISTKDLLRPITKKMHKFVCLKVNPTVLQDIKLNDNPFKVKGNTNGKSTKNSIFKSMMNNQTINTVKKTPLQKLKEMDPPILNCKDFHIYEQTTCFHSNDYLSALPRRFPRENDTNGVFEFIPYYDSLQMYPSTTLILNSDLLGLINSKIPNWQLYPQLTTIVDRFITKKYEKTSELWIELFKPESTSGLMMADVNVIQIQNWINNSYGLLKANSLKQPRNILLQQRKRKETNKNSFNGFIVDDSIDDLLLDDSETEEDIFMPLLLIQGSTGSCKSTAVYSAMNANNGYVFEINTGINRGRKDIYNSLKEFCTTQLVHKQNESKQFQRGLVLLEDVDILFEQDKSFWSVVQDILNISRRPLVLTCEDFSGIPKSILDYATEEDSIIRVDENQVSRSLIFDYLWICSLSQGFIFSDCTLNSIISLSYNGHNYDLRKCLMECQMVCQASHEPENGELACFEKLASQPESQQPDFNILTEQLESLSCADVIQNNTISSLNHETISNEFVDLYIVDDSTKLTQTTLTFELNVGDYIYKSINQNKVLNMDQPKPNFTFNQMKQPVLNFISSRSKKKPKFIQDMLPIRRSTRSHTPFDDNFEFEFNGPTIVGIPDTSFLIHSTQTSFVLDLLPHVLEWISYQRYLNQAEEESSLNGTEFFKSMVYRDFQDVTLDIGKYVPNH